MSKLSLKEYKRVLQITKKPDFEEFKVIVKVTSLGMIVIGMLGFFIQLINQVFL